MSATDPTQDPGLEEQDEDAMLDPSEALEEIPQNDDEDHHMDSDPDDDGLNEEQEIQLQNDSVAHFDLHTDSIFAIAQHPTNPTIIATGGGDDTTYIWSSLPPSTPLPQSYETSPSAPRSSLPALAKLSGHTDSINALTFTLPDGAYLLTGGLDGQLRIHNTSPPTYPLLASAQEVPEINFLTPTPHPSHPNTFALGASDGSVWVYTIDATDPTTSLQVIQAYYLHTASCTAGAWTPDGNLLATVSEDGSFHLWDPFGAADAAGIKGSAGSQALVNLTNSDARFAVEGGLYSVAIAPSGAFAVVGGNGGMIRVVGLPRLGVRGPGATAGQKGGGAKNKSGGGKRGTGSEVQASSGQAGQILASLQVQAESVETLAFSAPPATFLAAGSVDGSVVVFDTAYSFAVRRHLRDAHEGFAVVKVEFVGALLTSCGMDGVVRRWDPRGTTAAAAAAPGGGTQGLVWERRGHRGEGEGGGVLGFVQGGGGKVVTAGDDGVGLVFEADGP